MVLRAGYVRAVVAALAMGALGAASACGNEPVGVEACRQIEGARCENARSCGISLTTPVHHGDSPSQDVGACKRFYRDACLHGFVAKVDPGAVAVQGCIEAINSTMDCEVVKAPEKHPACAFLIPAPEPPPAPAPAPIADAATE